MNKYDLPLTTPSVQTIVPAMNRSGVVYGWYPITSHSFSGVERTYTLSDGLVIPITTVTKDKGMYGVQQYMAAVFPLGIANDYKPWASTLLIKPDSGYYRWWSMPSEGWVLHFGSGSLIESLSTRMNISAVLPAVPGAPTVTTPLALSWQASIPFEALTGDCEFFDFNWMTLFQSQSTTLTPLRIIVLTNPAPIAPSTVPPIVATVIGNPIMTANGPLYDTIRLMKLGELAPGSFAFTFSVIDDRNQSTTVTLNLTVQ